MITISKLGTLILPEHLRHPAATLLIVTNGSPYEKRVKYRVASWQITSCAPSQWGRGEAIMIPVRPSN